MARRSTWRRCAAFTLGASVLGLAGMTAGLASGVLTAVIFSSCGDKMWGHPPVGAGWLHLSCVSEQTRSYHRIAEKGRKNHAIPLIWRR